MLNVITLNLNPALVISAIVLVINLIAFVIVYNKYIKATVNQDDLKALKKETEDDLKELKEFVIDKNRVVHHRLDAQRTDLRDAVARIEAGNLQILNHVLKIKK